MTTHEVIQHQQQQHQLQDVGVHEVPVLNLLVPMHTQPVMTHLLPIEVVQEQNEPQHEVPELKKEKSVKKKKEAIDGQAKEIIFKVIKFFESEKQNRGYAFPVENVVKRASAATGLSESTIKRIKRDGLRAEATQTKMTGPKKKRVRKTKVQLDYFQLCALRGMVNSYSLRKEVPTLGKILASAKNELNFKGGKESLRLILLNKLGIKFKKCEKKNKKPPEQPPVPPPPPQQNLQTIMPPPPMPPMKPMENHCVYSNMMQHVPPVSY